MEHTRHIKSYVLRAGRMTEGQSRALQTLWPRYGVDFAQQRLDLDALFGGAAIGRAANGGAAIGRDANGRATNGRDAIGQRAPRCLEIGFGIGEVIGGLAKANPHIDYLGIEVHRPGVGRLLQFCAAENIYNLRIICHDAVEVLEHGLADATLDEVLIFFPDPWHKKRHHKRRLINAEFLALVARRLRAGGILRMATDWQDYAQQMLEVGNACPALESLSPDGTFVEHYAGRASTRFERRGERLGHGVWDLAYRRRA